MCHPTNARLVNLEEIEMFSHLWEELSQSEIVRQLWKQALEDLQTSDSCHATLYYNNNSDFKILQANRSLLRSIESIHQTTLRYLDTAGKIALRPVHLPPAGSYARQTPTSASPNDEMGIKKEDHKEYESMSYADADVNDCAKWLSELSCERRK